MPEAQSRSREITEACTIDNAGILTSILMWIWGRSGLCIVIEIEQRGGMVLEVGGVEEVAGRKKRGGVAETGLIPWFAA